MASRASRACCSKGGAFQARQGVFGAVQQARLEEVQRQCVLGTLAVFGAQGRRAAEQVLVYAHGAVVFAAAAEQVAQGKVQLRRCPGRSARPR
jgi:hypothetical protein